MTKGGGRAAVNAKRRAENEAARAALVSPEEAVRIRIRHARTAKEEASRARVLKISISAPAEGPNTLALALESNADVEVDRDAGYKTRAMRWDVFELMHQRNPKPPAPQTFPLAYHTAVRRFQDDLAILYDTQGGHASTMTGNTTPDPLQAWLSSDFSIRRVLAAVRLSGRPASPEGASAVQGVLGLMKRWEARLLLALSLPDVVEGRRVNWHDTVRTLTGETRRIAQGDLVKAACRSLAAAYGRIDNEARPQSLAS